MKYTDSTATVADWYERKLVNDGTIHTIGGVYIFKLFAIIKETEKAVYAMCLTGVNGDRAIRKTIWIPKSVINGIEDINRIDSYEDAVTAFEANH